MNTFNDGFVSGSQIGLGSLDVRDVGNILFVELYDYMNNDSSNL